MVEDDIKGIKPFYRSKYWNLENRKKAKDLKKQSWWKSESKSKIDYKSVCFVPPTPGGKLIKEMKIRETEMNRNSDERIKFLESGGIQMKNILSSNNPFKRVYRKIVPIMQRNGHCSKNEKENKISCRTNNIGYRWICDTCEKRNIIKIYEGESSRYARIRSKEHAAVDKNKKADSVNTKCLITKTKK